MGTLYSEGKGTKKDDKQANHWFEKAAQSGNPEAQEIWATRLLFGVGGSPNASAAAKWYARAVEQGNTKGKIMLAYLYEIGDGVPQDFQAAAKLYEEEARSGSALAQYRLGLLYAWGEGVPVDYKKAEALWASAAARGNVAAKEQIRLWNEGTKTSTIPKGTSAELIRNHLLTLPLSEGLWEIKSKITIGSVTSAPEDKSVVDESRVFCAKKPAMAGGVI